MSNCVLCEREVKTHDGANRKRCASCNTRIRRYRIKKKLIELAGGKCQRCYWDKHLAGLEFHHKDSSEKEFGLGSAFTTNWERAKKEAQKCELLCSCCHRLEHSKEQEPKFLELVKDYQGRNLR